MTSRSAVVAGWWRGPATSRRAADLVAAHDDLPGMTARDAGLRPRVAVLFGRENQVLDPELHARCLVEALPAAALTIIDGGHMILVTQPDETAD